jgi:gliding motility-associated-like protein
MIPSLICPNDSVKLIVSGTGTYHWQGPYGAIGGNSSFVYVTIPGFYYCVVDSGTCRMSSNALEVKQYATPFLLTQPSTVLCAGATVEINVITNDNSLIQWLAPLNGSDPVQVISNPGVYTCNVTSCSILTQASVTITTSDASAAITASGPLHFCEGDSVILQANSGMVMYQWTPTGSLDPSIVVFIDGNYSVTTTDGYGCTASSTSLTISTDSTPRVIVNAPDRICIDSSAVFTSSFLNNVTYSWSGPNGYTSNSNEITFPYVQEENAGVYHLTVSNGICSSDYSTTLAINDCSPIIIPNVITPNGDGKNDFFLFNFEVEKMDCEIFNRWGNLIYQSSSTAVRWDGNDMNGHNLSDGVYYYILHLTPLNRDPLFLKGYIQLIR